MSTSGNHTWDIWAKIGYKQNMKLKELKCKGILKIRGFGWGSTQVQLGILGMFPTHGLYSMYIKGYCEPKHK
jgi:hypothetical protein